MLHMIKYSHFKNKLQKIKVTAQKKCFWKKVLMYGIMTKQQKCKKNETQKSKNKTHLSIYHALMKGHNNRWNLK